MGPVLLIILPGTTRGGVRELPSKELGILVLAVNIGKLAFQPLC